MFHRFRIVRQYDSVDCALACLKMICQHYKMYHSLDASEYSYYISKDGISLASVVEIARKNHFEVTCGKVFLEQLTQEVTLPCILYWNRNHFVVLYKISQLHGKFFFHIADPAKGRVVFSLSEFEQHWSTDTVDSRAQGIVILLEPNGNCQPATVKKRKTGKKTFLPILLSYKKMLLYLLLGVLIGAGIQMAFPILTQWIVDKGIEGGDISFILMVLIGQMALITGNMFNDFFRKVLVLKLGSRFSISLLTDLVTKMLRLPVRFFDSKPMGDFIQRLQDHDKVERFVTVYFVNCVFSLITLLVLGIVLMTYNGYIFLVFVLGSILYIIWTYLFVNKRKTLNYELFAVKAKNQGKYYEILKGITEIKLQNLEQRNRDDIENIQKDLYHTNVKALKIDQYLDVGNVFINELKNILITFLSAYFVIRGDITFGMMMSIQYIIGELNVPIAQFLTFIAGYQDAKLSLDRMNSIFSIDNEEDGDKEAFKPQHGVISVEHLHFKYVMSGNDILHDMNLCLPLGKKIAIVGSSGSGKTTLVKLLLKLYEPTQGKIVVSNTDIKNVKNRLWRNSCGAVLQDGFIFSGTLRENIILEKSFNEERFHQAVSISNVETFAEPLPYKYETRIGDNGMRLSQGQIQRILIARAIYKNPDIFFFDEATNSLDANNEKDILEKLKPILKGKTVFVVAHRLSTVKDADIILVMDHGTIIEQGTHTSLVEKQGYYYQSSSGTNWN
ncbi:peptidase domain-containing ABC transporter [Prevotella sp. oral taxon 317]|uniref:peptidase domain-containing ABC transporter n=1 Tax=Prevotella sp. oral taxon 317 TaxID=652721 RepID=UPI0001C403CC|nr:peptidase domain-containing ABC transporter [Prevotella sp. oral taxon 317]EFC69841.1 ABC transporter, ATP-binding protein [Prevotella sp. oral taxon 317 str. F0108]